MSNIIHVTARNRNVSAQFEENMAAMQALYPDWTLCFHTDADIDEFVQQHFPEVWAHVVPKLRKKIMLVDLVRYMWMYVEGGMYADLDIAFSQRIELGAKPTFIRRAWTHPQDATIQNSVHNCLFFSPPGHPLWLQMIMMVSLNTLHQAGWRVLIPGRKRSVFDLTGPNALSRCVDRYLESQAADTIHILPANTLYQAGKSESPLSDASVEHQMAQSWSPDAGK